MAEFIAPIVDWLVGVLKAADMGDLKPFPEVRQSWTGVVVNWPPCAVMPRGTRFDAEGSPNHETHSLTVKFGVVDANPDQVTAAAMAYMAAIGQAIDAAEWLPDSETFAMRRVFISDHDYGPLYEKTGGYAKFPEMYVDVEVYEL